MSLKASVSTTKSTPSEMSSDVRVMIDLRHDAEQRGHYAPLGRLLYLETAHGMISWPSHDGEGVGPDLALAVLSVEAERAKYDFKKGLDFESIVLGQWMGLPALRKNSTTPCAKCRHACDVCDGSGKKQCEGLNCGGRGTVPGKFMLCPAPKCSEQTGKINPAGCEHCGNSGQVAEMIVCPMCCGSKLMTCSRCRGKGKFSTGRVNGSLDWQLPKCKACAGTGWKGKLEKYDLNKFINAELVRSSSSKRRGAAQHWLVLGPIISLALLDYATGRTRTFEVSADEAGDLLVLLVPASPRQKPQKAYLVGGVVRERESARGAA
jgi:hypothetical protein